MFPLDAATSPSNGQWVSDETRSCLRTSGERAKRIAALRHQVAAVVGIAGAMSGCRSNGLDFAFEEAKRSLSVRCPSSVRNDRDVLNSCTEYQARTALAGRVQDALDLVDEPVVPPDSDPDAARDPPVDPRLVTLGEWLVDHPLPAAAAIQARDDTRRSEASAKATALVTGAERFDPQICEDLVRALIHSGDTDAAWGLLCGVRAADVAHRPTMVSYLALIDQFGREGRGHRANQAFERLRLLYPDEMRAPRLAKEPYDLIIAASDRSGHSEAVLRHAETMRAAGVPRDGDTVMALVNARSRLGERQAACQHIEEAFQAGVPIHAKHVVTLVKVLIDSAEQAAAVKLLLTHSGAVEGVFGEELGWTGREIDSRGLAHGPIIGSGGCRDLLVAAQVLANDKLGRLGGHVTVRLDGLNAKQQGGLSVRAERVLRHAGWHLRSVERRRDGARLVLTGDATRPFKGP